MMLMMYQEDQNRGKPNWEHLNEDLHVLISVDDTENRAKLKLARAVDEVKKLLVPTVSNTLITVIWVFARGSLESGHQTNAGWSKPAILVLLLAIIYSEPLGLKLILLCGVMKYH